MCLCAHVRVSRSVALRHGEQTHSFTLISARLLTEAANQLSSDIILYSVSRRCRISVCVLCVREEELRGNAFVNFHV